MMIEALFLMAATALFAALEPTAAQRRHDRLRKRVRLDPPR